MDLPIRDVMKHKTSLPIEEACFYSKRNCKKCNSKGYVQYSFPGQYPEYQACTCVLKALGAKS